MSINVCLSVCLSDCLLPICPISTLSVFSRCHLPILFYLLSISNCHHLFSSLSSCSCPSSSSCSCSSSFFFYSHLTSLHFLPCLASPCLASSWLPCPSLLSFPLDHPANIHPSQLFLACDLLFCMKGKQNTLQPKLVPSTFLSICLPLSSPTLYLSLSVTLLLSLPPFDSTY